MKKCTIFCPDKVFCRMLSLETEKYYITESVFELKDKQTVNSIIKSSDLIVCDMDSCFSKIITDFNSKNKLCILFSEDKHISSNYLKRPFDIEDYISKLKEYSKQDDTSEKEDFLSETVFDDFSKSITFKGNTVFLSKKEFELFSLFYHYPDKTFSRDEIKESVFGVTDSRSNVDSVYINYLRNKFKNIFGNDPIETVRGTGYKLNTRR